MAAPPIPGRAVRLLRRLTRPLTRRLAWLLAPTLAITALAMIAMGVRTPTRVALELVVDRVVFQVAAPGDGAPAVPVLAAGRVARVRLERAVRVTLAPDTLEIADEARFDLRANRFPPGAWRALPMTGALVLAPAADAAPGSASLTVRPAEGADAGQLKLVQVAAGAEVVMALGREEGGQRAWLTVMLPGQPGPAPHLDLVFPGRFLVLAEGMGLAGTPLRAGTTDSLSLRAASRGTTGVAVTGSARGLVVQLEPGSAEMALLAGAGIPIAALDLTRQGPAGARQSSLIGPGTLRWPDLPGREPLALAAGHFVAVEGLRKARIEGLGVGSAAGGAGGPTGLGMRLDLTAGHIRVGTPERPFDARLTLFDRLWTQPKLTALLTLVVWLFGTTLAGRKLWREERAGAGDSEGVGSP